MSKKSPRKPAKRQSDVPSDKGPQPPSANTAPEFWGPVEEKGLVENGGAWLQRETLFRNGSQFERLVEIFIAPAGDAFLEFPESKRVARIDVYGAMAWLRRHEFRVLTREEIAELERRGRPAWLPSGWQSATYPANDSDQAFRQWFDWQIARLESPEPRTVPARAAVEDAMLIVAYLRRTELTRAEAEQLAADVQPVTALRAIRQRLFEQGPATASGQGEKPKRGRPRETNIEGDRRIDEAWKTGQYKQYADLEREMRLPRGEVGRAIERHRKRERRANE